MDERRAIERLKRGDIGGLEALVRSHQTRAVRAAYLICRDRALAEDVVQAAFVRTYEKIARFDAERAFGPWFMKIVVNDAIKAASRRERMIQFQQGEEDPVSLLVDPQSGPYELAEEAEERRRVWAALEKLPPAQRAVVVQRYYLGMSEAEMAESETSPPGTIKWRLHAARKRLSKLLGPELRAQGPTSTRPAPAGPLLDSGEGGVDRD
ncbi:MAG: RNA polymerase sigma factor [Actinomycetota bacterium]|nr:RNA polymerase sigma factor [Actinomycetota bacterium]MDP9477669.1 RNA polymerase sigma factor [Actinomycetota bacterium]